MCGDEVATAVGEDRCEGVWGWVVQDEASEFGVIGGEFGGEDGSETGAGDDDTFGGYVAGEGEPGEGPFGVLAEEFFARVACVVHGLALPIAAIVEGEDVEPGAMEGGEGIDGTAETAVGAVEIEQRSPCSAGGNPPAGETGISSFGGAESDCLKGQAEGGRGAGDFGLGVVEELPVACVVEEA